MKIRGTRLTVIDLPLKAPYLSSQNTRGKTSTTRTIVQLFTDGGLEGIGETNGTPEVVSLLLQMSESFIGLDVRDVRAMRKLALPNVYRNYNGRNGWIAFAGIEMACWDAMGKAFDTSVHQLIGGAVRERVEIAGLMSAFPVHRTSGSDPLALVRDPATLKTIVEEAQHLIAQYGFTTLKIKSTGTDWRWDASVMESLRGALGKRVELRLDPNGAFTVTESLRLANAVELFDLQYLEDPTLGIEAMARLRRDIRTPLATNMCVINFEQLPVALRMGAVDVVLGDVYHWGGILGFVELASVCETFGIGMGVHSFVEAGVGTAVNLHLAASLPSLNHAIDAMLHFQDVSILTGIDSLRGGEVAVPQGAGLGVELDEEVIAGLAVGTHTVGV